MRNAPHRLADLLLIVAGLAIATTPAYAQSDDGDPWFVISIYLVGAFFYLIPTYVAFFRRHPNRWVIFLVNVFLGGTGIGWFGALIWAFTAVHRSNDPNGSHVGESGLNITANDPVWVRVEPAPAAPPPLPTPTPANGARPTRSTGSKG